MQLEAESFSPDLPQLMAPNALRGLCRALVLCALVASAGLASTGGAWGQSEDTPRYLGRTLEEALLDLQAQDLPIVFSRALVRPELKVEVEPTSRRPREILDQLLAPHGLEAVDAPGGSLVVVAAGADDTGVERLPATIQGEIHARHSREPVAGALVQVTETGVETRSGANGRFVLAGLEAGIYTVEVRARGFVPEQVSEVVVGRSGAQRIRLSLRPAPFVHDEIVVRPSQLSLLRAEPASPLSLSKEEIESLPHLAGDLFRALSLVPGVSANDVTAQFSIHGGRRDEVQILLDGQELYDAFHLKDFDNALSIVAPQTLDSANLATGGFTVAHGDRMGGVLDLRTTGQVSARKTSLSLSLLNAAAATAGGFDEERGLYLASARRGSIDLASRLLGKEDPSFWDAFGKSEYQLSDRHRLSAHYLRAGDRLAFGEVVDDESKRFDTDYQSEILWLSHQLMASERLLLELRASRTEVDRDRRGVEDEDSQSFAIFDRRRFDVTQLKQVWSWQSSPRHRLEIGASARRYRSDFEYSSDLDRALNLAPPWADERPNPALFGGALSGDHFEIWSSDRWSPIEALTLELGLRFDRHTATDDTLWSPRLNFAWRLGESSVARLSWGSFHQSQRPYELQVEDGERRLQPAERAEHLIIGYERQLARREASPLAALRIELYDRRVRDPRPRFENLFEPLNVFPEAEPDRVRLVPERGRARGLEVVLRGAVGSRGDWWLNYAVAESEERFGAEVRPRQLDQTHTFNFDVGYRLGKSWSVNLAWRYHTGWPTTAAALAVVGEDEEGEPEYALALGPVNAERLSAYHRLDLRASRQFSLRRGKLTFFLDVQNVYDRQNLAGFDHEVDEDSGRLVRSPELWTGILPSAGITWEF